MRIKVDGAYFEVDQIVIVINETEYRLSEVKDKLKIVEITGKAFVIKIVGSNFIYLEGD